MRNCTKCLQSLPEREFSKDKSKKDGFFRWCKKCGKEKQREYRKTDKGIIVSRDYKLSTKYKDFQRKYGHFPKRREWLKKWRHSEKARNYKRLRLQNDIPYRLSVVLRKRIRNHIRGKGTRAGSAVRDLGCSVTELKVYLEKQFTNGMNWQNYGKWHIDHIKPLSRFDLTNREQFLEAAHYTNLQPLWAFENIAKGNKLA